MRSFTKGTLGLWESYCELELCAGGTTGLQRQRLQSKQVEAQGIQSGRYVFCSIWGGNNLS